MKFILFILLNFLIIPNAIFAKNINSESFENIYLEGDATTVTCFAQDQSGLMWFGTNNGLYSFDGFQINDYSHISEKTRIHCMLVLDASIMCIGSDNGLSFFNYQNDKLINKSIKFPMNIRSLCLIGDDLWIGSVNGLYQYNLKTETLDSISVGVNGIPHKTIYSLAKMDNQMYVGTYNGLVKYDVTKKEFTTIHLSNTPKKNNQFINALLYDSLSHKLWVGSEGALSELNTENSEIKIWPQFDNNSVKTLALDSSNNLLVGTDDGLFICDLKTSETDHLIHDSRNNQSLINNIIWSIFRDSRKNVWIGTDFNISLARFNESTKIIPISQITGVGDGNRFFKLKKDSKNRYWLGGSNGLILALDLENHTHNKWFRMGHTLSLAHNRIRDIYETPDDNVFIATDASIALFDESKQQFKFYSIQDSTFTYNSNWSYNIIEDNKGYLWVATCMGGVFILDKSKLLKSNGTYVADKNLTVADGLNNNFITQLQKDKTGNIWALFYKGGLCYINADTHKVTQIDFGDNFTKEMLHYMLIDKNDKIWLAAKNRVYKYDIETRAIIQIPMRLSSKDEILYMLDQDQYLWLSTLNTIYAINKETLDVEYSTVIEDQLTSGFYDSKGSHVYWGGNDKLISVNTDLSSNNLDNKDSVFISNLLINNKNYKESDSFSEKLNIRYLKKIELKHDENNLTFFLSNFTYTNKYLQYVYRLIGFDDKWNVLDQNSILFGNLPYGDYTLEIARITEKGAVSDSRFHLSVVINPPYYLTLWAKLLYLLISISLIIWVINFFRVKHNLKIERIEKEKTLELSKMKMDFFTHVSHELKTPLSMIIGPLSLLITETKDRKKKNELELIQNHAYKINSMVKQVIDFNREESLENNFTTTKIDIISFAKNIFLAFQANFSSVNIAFVFKSNIDQLIWSVDILKMESILNNILSNACKYTLEGHIKMNIFYEKGILNISVIDTGIGIPNKEINDVTDRFYRSSKTVNSKTGTGLGLFLVNKYVQQHQGELIIQSEEDKGTSVQIVLEDKNKLQETVRYDTDDKLNFAEGSLSQPLICIIEDNTDIANLICKSLKSKYKCQVFVNADEAMKTGFSKIPDLIITDLMMPGADGMHYIKYLKSNIPTASIPIIVITAKDDKETQTQCFKYKIDVFISKPFDVEILLYRVDQLLTKHQQIETKLKIERITTPKDVEKETVSSDEKLLSVITNYIEEHLEDPSLNVAALSTHTGIGAKQIYRKIKQQTGLSPVEYIRLIKIRKAALLLKQKIFNIKEVMYMVGFSDYSYFVKIFQAEYGKSPRKYMEDFDI